ncbi:integral membrane protein [Paraphaeosphaeria minitans]|uniref:Integral membrane protein n=1 Tax=Paraphaeosphaeria minitans TaxID=565426 RepID=A0A9P6GUG7_9PLEO|nr:integral membrane protein [Paraphaeosphaeria minitans]
MLDHNTRGRQAVILSSVFSAFATFTVLLRLYTRLFIIRCPGVEDYFVSIAMICSIGLNICIGIREYSRYSQYAHSYSDTATAYIFVKAFYASLIVYYLSLGFTKVSILLQYRRVFSTKKFQIACHSVMGVVVIYALWTVLSSIFGCKPIQAFWTLKHPFTCLDQSTVWFFNGAMNILTDLSIIVLPMPVIRKLNLPPRQKQALIGIFAIGGFVCLVSILRLQSLVAISNSLDPTYDNPPAATWSSIETNIGIICSCLPCLRPLVTRYLPGIFSNTSSRSGQSGESREIHRGSRNTFSRRSGEASTNVSTVKSEDMFDMSQFDDRESIIRVVREVHVTVENRQTGAHVKEEV